MRDQNVNFNFGTLPDDFNTQYTFSTLIEQLKNIEFGILNNWICADGKFFKVSHLHGGDKSAKNIYKITANKRNYIIKMDRFYPEDKLTLQCNPYYSRIAKESKLLRGDSVYADACLDYYLQLNECKHNAKLLYYDFQKNASIYEYVDGEEISDKEKLGLVGQIQANNLFSDVNNLGIYLNDIGTSLNCYQDKFGNPKLIDVGHAEYLDLLKPGGRDLTFELSNLCGFSFKNVLASLNTDMLSALSGTKDDISDDFLVTITSLNTPADKIIKGSNVDLETFMLNKKINKDKIKSEILWAEANYGLISKEALEAHTKLREFYEINIAARNAGYGDASYDIINDIKNAISRENKIIANIKDSLY